MSAMMTTRAILGTPVLFCSILVLMLVSPAGAEGTGDGLAAKIERARRATVGILRHSEGMPAQVTRAHFAIRGTGFHFRDGYIVTASHAVKRQEGGKTVIPQEISVLTGDMHEFPATLTGVHAFLDLAVYRLKDAKGTSVLGTVPFSKTEPRPGDEILTIGYPLGWGPTIAYGRVGNTETFLRTVQARLMQLDLSTCSGNSGGGLFNVKGEIVGVVHAIIQTEGIHEERECSRMGFAVPGPLVQRIVAALIAGKQVTFPRLGIQMTTVKIGTQWRVAVSGVTGPAREAGLKKGDVVLSIEGTTITNAAQLKHYVIEHTEPGQRVQITVLRGEEELVLAVTLGQS